GIPDEAIDGTLTTTVANKKLVIETPVLIDGQAVVISQISQKKTGWKLIAQLLNNTDSKEVIKDLTETNVFVTKGNAYESYKI
ncbi:hypothetical protein D5E79_26735, partial [Vibrio parahaemolyticus]